MNKAKLIILLIIISTLSTYGQSYQNVDSKTFSELLKSEQGILLDVRTSGEYAQGHIANSTLISTNDPQFVKKVQLLQKNKPIYVYCLTGSRSRAVANYLTKNGFTKVYNLQRGIMEWKRYGFETTKSSANVATAAKTYSITDFNKLITSNQLVLVDFHAPWCAPCKQMAPTIDKLQKSYNQKALITKLNVQANQSVQQAYDVQSIPGLILFKNGKQVWKHTGIISYEDLSGVLNKYL